MATIQNATARKMLYYWHGGQGSAFYAAASSGLVASFTALALECDAVAEPDKSRLLCWLQKRQSKFLTEVAVCGKTYRVLPWVGRT